MKKNFAILSKEIKRAIKKTIREDLRHEAERILLLTTDKNRMDFMQYYEDDKGNICCLVLDSAKKDLVEAGKLEQKDTDAFGKKLI